MTPTADLTIRRMDEYLNGNIFCILCAWLILLLGLLVQFFSLSLFLTLPPPQHLCACTSFLFAAKQTTPQNTDDDDGCSSSIPPPSPPPPRHHLFKRRRHCDVGQHGTSASQGDVFRWRGGIPSWFRVFKRRLAYRVLKKFRNCKVGYQHH